MTTQPERAWDGRSVAESWPPKQRWARLSAAWASRLRERALRIQRTLLAGGRQTGRDASAK